MNYIESHTHTHTLCMCAFTVSWYILNFSSWIERTSEPNSPRKAGKHSCKRASRRRRRRCQFIVSHQKLGLINPPMQFMAKCVYCCWHRNYTFCHTTSLTHTHSRFPLYFVGNVFYVGKLLRIRHAPF